MRWRYAVFQGNASFTDAATRQVHAANAALEKEVLETGYLGSSFFEIPKRKIVDEASTRFDVEPYIRKASQLLGYHCPVRTKSLSRFKYFDLLGTGFAARGGGFMWVAAASDIPRWRAGRSDWFVQRLLAAKAPSEADHLSERARYAMRAGKALACAEAAWNDRDPEEATPAFSSEDIIIFCLSESATDAAATFSRSRIVPVDASDLSSSILKICLGLEDLGEGWLYHIEEFVLLLENKLKRKAGPLSPILNAERIVPVLPSKPEDPEPAEEAGSVSLSGEEKKPSATSKSRPRAISGTERAEAARSKFLEFGWTSHRTNTDGQFAGISVTKHLCELLGDNFLPLRDRDMRRLMAMPSMASAFLHDQILLAFKYDSPEKYDATSEKEENVTPDKDPWTCLPPLPGAVLAALRRLLPECDYSIVNYIGGCSKATDAAVLERLVNLACYLETDFKNSRCRAVIESQINPLLNEGHLSLPSNKTPLLFCELIDTCLLNLLDKEPGDLSEGDAVALGSSEYREPDPEEDETLFRACLQARETTWGKRFVHQSLRNHLKNFVDQLKGIFSQSPIDQRSFLRRIWPLLRGDSSHRILRDVMRALLSEIPMEKLSAQEKKLVGPGVKGAFSTALRTFSGYFAVENDVRELFRKRIRFVALVPSDNYSADYSPTGLSTALSVKIGKGNPAVGQRGSSRFYGKLFSPTLNKRSVPVDMRDLLNEARRAIRPPGRKYAWHWLRNKISNTNEMVAFLMQHFDYVSLFPFSDLPRTVSQESPPELLLARLNSPLIVRCLYATEEGAAALNRWKRIFKEAIKLLPGGITPSQKNSYSLLRDDPGLACVALDTAREALKTGTFHGFVYFNPDIFDSVFWTPPPVSSLSPVAENDDAGERGPENEPSESDDNPDNSDSLLTALENVKSTPEEILARMDREIAASTEKIDVHGLIDFLYDKIKEHYANSSLDISEINLESGELQDFPNAWRKLNEIERLIADREVHENSSH